MSDNEDFKAGFEAGLIRAAEIARIHYEAAIENMKMVREKIGDPAVSAKAKKAAGLFDMMSKFAAKSTIAKAIKEGIIADGLRNTMSKPAKAIKPKSLPAEWQQYVKAKDD